MKNFTSSSFPVIYIPYNPVVATDDTEETAVTLSVFMTRACEATEVYVTLPQIENVMDPLDFIYSGIVPLLKSSMQKHGCEKRRALISVSIPGDSRKIFAPPEDAFGSPTSKRVFEKQERKIVVDGRLQIRFSARACRSTAV